VDLNYIVLSRISEITATDTDREAFFLAVADIIAQSIPAPKILILLFGARGASECHARRGPDEMHSADIIARVRATRQALITFPDEQPSASLDARHIRSVLCAPILKAEDCIGCLYLEQGALPGFSNNDLVLVATVANHLAAGMERVELCRRIQEELVIRSNLERFFSPPVAAKIATDSLKTSRLALFPEKVNATILFMDIKGFTLLCERLTPAEIAALLRDYYTLMTDCIFQRQGTLDKYIGDAIMAVFGAPLALPDHARQAALSARDMLKAHRRFKAGLEERKKFDIRIGFNSGEVVAGYMGSPRRMEYTVLGDAVVIAKRLESLAEPNTAYLGGETEEQLRAHGRPDGRDAPRTALVKKMATPKGQQEIEIYKLIVE
jgi:adenylate cyclase